MLLPLQLPAARPGSSLFAASASASARPANAPRRTGARSWRIRTCRWPLNAMHGYGTRPQWQVPLSLDEAFDLIVVSGIPRREAPCLKPESCGRRYDPRPRDAFRLILSQPGHSSTATFVRRVLHRPTCPLACTCTPSCFVLFIRSCNLLSLADAPMPRPPPSATPRPQSLKIRSNVAHSTGNPPARSRDWLDGCFDPIPNPFFSTSCLSR